MLPWEGSLGAGRIMRRPTTSTMVRAGTCVLALAIGLVTTPRTGVGVAEYVVRATVGRRDQSGNGALSAMRSYLKKYATDLVAVIAREHDENRRPARGPAPQEAAPGAPRKPAC
jgi:hypothetical protein